MELGSDRAEREKSLTERLGREFPGLEVVRVPGLGFEAYPKGTVILRAMDLDVLARKLRKRRDDRLGPVLTSNPVTAEDAARYEDGPAAFARVAGDQEGMSFPRVRFADGSAEDLIPGRWVVRFAPGDLGIMSDGEYRRWFRVQ